MSAMVAGSSSLAAGRVRAPEAACLAAVVLTHVAVLALLPSGGRSPSPPAPPVTVTLLAPPEPKPAPPAARVPEAAPAKPLQRPQQAAKPPAPPPRIERAPIPQPPLSQRSPAPAEARTEPTSPAVAPPAGAPSAAQKASPDRTPLEAKQGEPDPSAVQPPPVVPPQFDAAYLRNPKPEYPRLARRLGEQGTVLIDVYVGADGLPQRIELKASSGSPRLDQAARETVQRWKFVPARQGERPVAAWITVPIRFVLES